MAQRQAVGGSAPPRPAPQDLRNGSERLLAGPTSPAAVASPAATAPLRVLIANDTLGYEEWGLHGAGRVVMDLSRGLRALGVDVTTLFLRDTVNIRSCFPDQDVVCADRRAGDPRAVSDILRLVRVRGIQIAHLQGYGASTFGRLAALRAGIPSIVHIHADYRDSIRSYPLYLGWLDRVLAHTTNRALVVSEALRTVAVELQGFREEQVQVLHNAVDLEAFRPAGAGMRARARRELGIGARDRVVACVARLDPVKGIDVLIDAWRCVEAFDPRATLLLVGDGPERKDLERRARSCRAVRFLGYRTDVQELLSATDLAVLPSRNEGFGQVLVEAMAVGVPVVATKVGGIPEVVRPGGNGLLVPPGDSTSLATALITVLREERLRERLAREALRSVRRFTLPVAAGRLLEVYRDVLEPESERTARPLRLSDPPSVVLPE